MVVKSSKVRPKETAFDGDVAGFERDGFMLSAQAVNQLAGITLVSADVAKEITLRVSDTCPKSSGLESRGLVS